MTGDAGTAVAARGRDGESSVLLEVAVALPLFDTFTYRDPRGGDGAPLGSQVVVPFGRRTITGFVVGRAARATGRVRDIEAVVDGPGVDREILDLARWVAGYYAAPLGEVLRGAMPQGERAQATQRLRLTERGERLLDDQREGRARLASLRVSVDEMALLRRIEKNRSGLGVATARQVAAARDALLAEGLIEVADRIAGRVKARDPRTDARVRDVPVAAAAVAPPEPNVDQRAALDAMLPATGFSVFVLQGVTGSGKTEVYLRLIEEARRRGRGALVLVPEIALTPQLGARFRARFGDDVAILHSGLPPAQRREAWRRLRQGEVGIALGARSAVFAPVRDLGVIVVDEEHDGSFKQEEGVRYHGRDVAVVRGQRAGALVVLGSATPSLETMRNVEIGRYRRLFLPMRANAAAAARPLPPVEVVDLRRHGLQADGILSSPMAAAIAATLAAREQSILFLNRRGFAALMLCKACGHVVRCADCSVSLTYHRARARLLCHYCGASTPLPPSCPACGRSALTPLGAGTQRAEDVLRARFPGARIARLDRDTVGSMHDTAARGVLDDMAAGRIDILIGTQMVTKGHDFPGVTLVGILNADHGMNLPDFRAAERTFQVLEQVAGRAGRAERPGRVLVQTFTPEHPAIVRLRAHDYEGFAREELAVRRAARYPPFCRMMVLRLDGSQQRSAQEAANRVATAARARAVGLRVLGPAEAPLARLRGRYRHQVWLASDERAPLEAAARRAREVRLPTGVRLVIDVDPQSVL